MPLDYLYTPNKQEWIQRKIQIGRRPEEFKVLLVVLEILSILSHFREKQFFSQLKILDSQISSLK